jgi:hypothetical protein
MTNNKQQTAVEQFLNAIKDQILLSKEHLEMIESYADQCKEIEKEQQEKLSASWAKSREQTRETAMHIGEAQMRVIKNRPLILIYKISAIMKIVFADRFELNILDKDGWNLTQITFNKKEILNGGKQ